MFEKLLYPTDFSDVSKKALVYLKGMKSAGARQVVVLRVISERKMECISKGIAMAGKEASRFLKGVFEELLKEAAAEMQPIESELKAAGLDVKVRIERGAPHTKILEVAEEEKVSAIVIGSHGRSNLSEVLLGSVSNHVIRHARVPVLVIKAILIAYFAFQIGRKGASPSHTFGYKRAEILGAAVNVALLVAAAAFILYEAFQRFRQPQPVMGHIVMYLAAVGIVGNGLSAWLLHRDSSHSLNVRGAFLHMVGDMLTSVLVLANGLILIYRPWYWLDPLLSCLIVIFIVKNCWSILKEATGILMNATPRALDLEKIQEALQAIPGARVVFWVFGEKIRGGLDDAGYGSADHFAVPGNLPAVNAQVQEVVQRIEAARSEYGIERFYVCHNMVSDQGGYRQVCTRLLPLDREWAGAHSREKWPNRCLPMIGLPREEMFRHLFRQHLFVSLFRAFAQSMAGENAARLTAMQAAEKNILEVVEKLQADFREVRQAAITGEILDIISGVEALSDESRPV